MLATLRRTRYDLVIDMQGQLRSAFVTMVAGAPVRIGFDRPRPAVWKREGERLPKGTISAPGRVRARARGMPTPIPFAFPRSTSMRWTNTCIAADMLGCERTAADFTMPAHPEAAPRVAELFRPTKSMARRRS